MNGIFVLFLCNSFIECLQFYRLLTILFLDNWYSVFFIYNKIVKYLQTIYSICRICFKHSGIFCYRYIIKTKFQGCENNTKMNVKSAIVNLG